MLRHQLCQNLVLALDLLLQKLDAILLGRMFDAGFGLESGGPVLEELFLPAVEYRRLQPNSSHSFETGSCSSKCRLRMATFSSAV
jgi:hypothetical protein